MATFRVDEFLESEGMRLDGRDAETGNLHVSKYDAESDEFKPGMFDPKKYLSSKNVDPNDVDIVFNSPASAIDDNDLGFLDQMDMMAAKKPEEKLKFLEDKYGKENVSNENGKFQVKNEQGVWAKADTGFWAGLAKESPVIAAGIAGSVAGAPAGPLGIILGGALGAGLARLADVATAEAAGLRSESDAEDALVEVGKEFAQSLIFSGALKVGGKFIKGATSKLGGPIFDALDEAAETTALLTRRKLETIKTLFNPEHTKKVVALKDHLVKTAKNGTSRGVDTATKIQVREVTKVLKMARENSYKQFDAFKQKMNQNGLGNVKVEMRPVLDEVKKIKAALFSKAPGAVNESVDPSTLARMKDMITRIEQSVSPVNATRITKLQGALEKTLNPTKRLRIEKAITKLSSKEAKTTLSFDKARALTRNIDEIMENSGHYNAGDNAISSVGRGMFKDLRNSIMKAQGKDLKGQLAVDWNDMRTAYHNFRGVYDDFALVGNKFKNDERAAQTINKMMGGKGDFLTDKFKAVSNLAGPGAKDSFNKIAIADAARDLTPIYSQASGGPGQLAWNVTTLGLSSPRRTGSALAFKKISEKSVKTIRAAGKTLDFITKMDVKSKTAILQSKDLYRKLLTPLHESYLSPDEPEQ